MVRLGIIGTSAWTERMYINPLRDHPHAQIVAVCGRDPHRTQDFAARNGISHHDTDYRALLDRDLDAVIVSTPHNTHYEMTMAALERGLHVLCEKPLALTVSEAEQMTLAAEAAGVLTLLPFTYTYFPMLRYAAHLVEQGYIGTPRHLNWRAYSSLALNGEAIWRFDRRIGGEGVLADIGSHAIAVARMVFGDITHVSAQFAAFIQRDGIPMEHLASDYATLQVVFASGAHGTITVSMATFEPMQGGIRQALELSGSTGTLHYTNDFATRANLQGAQLGDPTITDIDIPESFWAPQISRANPRDMYSDLFNKSDAMAREFVSAIAAQRPVNGQTFRDGLAVQRVIDAAVESANNDGMLIVT